METILLLAHVEAGGSLAPSAREALRAARSVNKAIAGSNLFVGLIGENVQAAADSIAACPAPKYFGVAGAEFGQSRYATDAAAAEAICKAAQATIIVAPATSRWNRVLARGGATARRTGGFPCHKRSDAGGKPAVNRWYYRQRMEATLTRTQRPWFMLIDRAARRLAHAARDGGSGMVAGGSGRCRQAHHGRGHPRAEGRRADDPS